MGYDTNYTIPAVNKTGNYTLTVADYLVLGDATAGAFNLTLPTAVGIAGRRYMVKRLNSGANNVTVNTTLSQTIDGAATFVLTAQYQTVEVVSDGANWQTSINNKAAGSANLNVVSKTGNYTLTTSDNVVLGDATSGVFTLTLPTAVGNTGLQFTCKRINTNTNIVTVGTTSSQTIDAATTYDLTNPYQSITVVSDGANWQVI